MSLLSMDRAGCSIGWRRVVQNISFEARGGEFIGIAGLNGSGKTTLLKLIQRIYKPDEGTIHLKQQPLMSYSAKALARIIGCVPQSLRISFDFNAKQMVMLGRTPYLGILSTPSVRDERIAEDAMRKTDCLQFSDRSVLQLSAGELQRVCLAAALVQQPEILLLDEPTTALDLRQQSRLLRLLRQLKDTGITILCASHDLRLLLRYADKILLLHDGRQIAFGQPDVVLTPSVLRDLFEAGEETAYAR